MVLPTIELNEVPTWYGEPGHAGVTRSRVQWDQVEGEHGAFGRRSPTASTAGERSCRQGRLPIAAPHHPAIATRHSGELEIAIDERITECIADPAPR